MSQPTETGGTSQGGGGTGSGGGGTDQGGGKTVTRSASATGTPQSKGADVTRVISSTGGNTRSGGTGARPRRPTRLTSHANAIKRAEYLLATKGYLLPSSLEGKTRRMPRKRGLYLSDPRKMKEAAEYEPDDHRQIAHPTSNCETFMHLLKGTCGTGILAMPSAFNDSGYVVGSIGTCILGILCTYCIHILLNCCYVICKRRKVPSLSYTAVTEASFAEGPRFFKAWAPYAATTANVFLISFQIGICCVYVLFVSQNLQFGLKQFNVVVSIHETMLMILIPMILINYVRDLKYLAPFCALANLITIISFGIIYYYLFRDPINIHDKSPTGDVLRYPLFFGTVMFALEAVGVMIPLQNEMKTPRYFTYKFGVLNQAMACNITLYMFMGLFGYLRYGSEALGSVTLNFPSETEILATCVQLMLALAIFISYSLQFYVCLEILWTDYIGCYCLNSKWRRFYEYILRTTIVLFTFLLAALVPELDLFISLIGALCLSALGFAFPAAIQTCTYWHYIKGAQRVIMTIKNVGIVLIGIFGLVVGTWSSLDGIIKMFKGELDHSAHSEYNYLISDFDDEPSASNITILH